MPASFCIRAKSARKSVTRVALAGPVTRTEIGPSNRVSVAIGRPLSIRNERSRKSRSSSLFGRVGKETLLFAKVRIGGR